MNSYIDLVNFIKNNKDWKEKLSNPPYSISIKNNNPKHPDWYIFKYSQFATDFSNQLCKACRGVVLKINDNVISPVCVPFQKFFNFGEGNAAKIDWNNPVEISLKYDGCLIKLSKFNGEVNFFTNGSMDTNIIASEAITSGLINSGKTFQQLIDDMVFKYNAFDWVKNIPENITFMFELIGPDNRIIVDYKEPDLILHGCYVYPENDPKTWYEYDAKSAKKKYNVPFNTPELYYFKNIDEVINELNSWKKDKEGVVIRDVNFNRIKIKSEQYRALKFVKGENGFSDKSLYTAYFNGTLDDAVSVWEEVKDKAKNLKSRIKSVENLIKEKYQIAASARDVEKLDKKQVAFNWSSLPYKNILFEGYSNNNKTLNALKNGQLSYDKFIYYEEMLKNN